MVLNDLVYWYQKKIGTYDKQQWEKTVEQRIFGGFTNVPMRTAKLKTELIDVDLVRGSSFPKAKPKHGLTTVVWLATQRLLFLPLYRCWWIRQTSQRIFALFLLLYSLQLLNMCAYFCNTDTDQLNMVSPAEILMPVGMMLILCMVHSQIVSTNSGPAEITARNRSRVRRSRNERCRSGKLRSRRNLRSCNEPKSSHESATDGASNCNVSPSVRFAKKVSIESRSSIEKVQLDVEPSWRLLTEEETSGSSVSWPELVIPPIDQPSDGVAVENPANIDIVHQDDDGFESLNGNVSSDNDRTIACPDEPLRDDDKRTKDTGNSATFQQLTNDAAQVSENEPQNNRDAAVSPEVSNNIEIDSDRNGGPCDGPGESAAPRQVRRQTCESEEEGECEEAAVNHLTEATTSATEWMGVTTNSDVCSYSSDLEETERHSETNFGCTDFVEHPFSWELELPPSILLSSGSTASDRVSCTIWTRRDIKKAQLSVLDISSAIIARVESMPEGMDYFYAGLLLSLMLSLVPSMKRLSDEFGNESPNNLTGSTINVGDLAQITLESWSERLCNIIDVAFGSTLWERAIVLTLAFEKFSLSCLLFFLLAVAERTFKQRLLYAKLFSHLTSSRRARKSDLPHFRLNKVRNIKTWLSVRSYLKRRGPQRSVDVIVSAVFIVTLLLLSFVSLELIKDLESLHSRYNVEALLWSFALGIYILRFMTLGTKINKKYRNLSVLITEQINLYLQIEQKPHKKDELMVANSVLKLAADLIKELECPFKISGLSANPYLYTITKVVLLSALSGVLSELLGFKLKLHKITIK